MEDSGHRAPRFVQWVTLADGPMAGHRFARSELPGGPRFVVSMQSRTERGMLERHEYEFSGADSARWVRLVDLQPWEDTR